MISIQLLAFILLVFRLVSMTFITLVIWRQISLFGTKINFDDFPSLTKGQRRNIYTMRRILFAIAVVIFIGNLIPVMIDSVALLNEVIKTPGLRSWGILYAVSNAITSVFSAFMIWFLYRLAGFSGDK